MGVDPEIFFGPHVCGTECDGERGCYLAKAETGRYARISKAKSICMACPVRLKCLEWALETRQAYGVWGGATERDRNKMIAEQSRTNGKRRTRRTAICNQRRPGGE